MTPRPYPARVPIPSLLPPPPLLAMNTAQRNAMIPFEPTEKDESYNLSTHQLNLKKGTERVLQFDYPVEQLE